MKGKKSGTRDLFGGLAREAARREALGRLSVERGPVRAERDLAQEIQDPYEATFRAAHARLLEVTTQVPTPKAERLIWYDKRMRAGHAWHPHRQRLREANRWLKAIDDEIRRLT